MTANNRPYYIYCDSQGSNGPGFRVCPDAKRTRLKGFEDLDLFTHHEPQDDLCPFKISEARTGLALAHGISVASARRVAKMRLADKGIEAIKERLAHYEKENGLSPRYHLKSPDATVTYSVDTETES